MPIHYLKQICGDGADYVGNLRRKRDPSHQFSDNRGTVNCADCKALMVETMLLRDMDEGPPSFLTRG